MAENSTEPAWKPCGNNNPCPVCGGKRKCTIKIDADGDGVVKCTKTSQGAFRSTTDSVGEAHFHKIRNHKPVVVSEPPELAPERLHEIYAYFLSRLLTISSNHRENLRNRGLTDERIQQNGYRSIHAAAARSLAGELYRQFGEEIRSVPGVSFWEDDQPHINYPYVNKRPISEILLIPCRNPFGKIIAIKKRVDDPNWDGSKYVYLSSSNAGGRKASQQIHFPKGTPLACQKVRITEGELKADSAFLQTSIPTISIPGVGSWRKALPAILALGASEALLAFDADAKTNPHVAGALYELYQDLKKAGIICTVEYWDISQGKGIDDLLANGHQPNLAHGAEADVLIESYHKLSGADKLPPPVPTLPEIFCFLNEEKVVEAVLPELAKVPTIYQRGGYLVHIVRDAPDCPGIVRSPNSPSISALPEITLRQKLSSICRFQEASDDGPKAVRVPFWVTKEIHQLAEWPGIRKLETVVNYPVIRADGSIVEAAGYDSQTGLYVNIRPNEIAVPHAPTLEDAHQAMFLIQDLVCDFPFERPEHFAGWLSLVLTILSRFAFNGPSPLFVIDANTRGSGKTLLAELASLIITGQDFARMTNPRDDEEARKRITAIALRGDPLVLIDNVSGDLGSASLDSAITSTSWSDRILGKSEMTTLPLFTTWVATGNNISLGADTSRRVCHIRLLSPDERPEERTTFTIGNITDHVRECRPELLSAALTILKAYFVAGKPKVPMRPWGSFEGWSRIVRQAVIWVGQPDPGEAREALMQNSDNLVGNLYDLIRGWEIADPENVGMTLARLLEMLEFNSEQFSKLKNAVAEFCGSPAGKLPSAKSLGKKLAQIRCRVVGSKFIDAKENRTGTKIWFVRSTNSENRHTGENAHPDEVF